MSQLSCLLKEAFRHWRVTDITTRVSRFAKQNQLKRLNLCIRRFPFIHLESSVRQLFINYMQEVLSRTAQQRLLYSHYLGQACRKLHHLSAFVQALISSAHFYALKRQTFISLSDFTRLHLHLVALLMSTISACRPIPMPANKQRNLV